MKNKKYFFTILVIAIFAVGVKFYLSNFQTPDQNLMTQAPALIQQGQIVGIDVRSQQEVDENPSIQSIHIPHMEMKNRIDQLDPSKTYFIFCQSGGRASTVISEFESRGIKVYNVKTWQNWNELIR